MKTIYTNSNKTIQKALFVLFIFILLTQYGYSQFSATEIRINSTPSTTNSCGGGLLGTVFTDSHHDTTTLLGVVTGYKYGINENYTKTICSDNGGTLSIDFTSLGIDNNDHLKVYDGPNTSSAQIYDFTNTGTAPGAVYSTGTCLTFVFTSDANTPSFFGQSRSWSGTVSCVVINKVNDPTTVTGCGSLFTDDGGPNQNYAGNQTSIKTFCPGTAGGCLLATFSQFDLESANDKLEVYDGSTATGTPIATYTGSTIPADINPSKGNCLTFKFTTNGTVQNKGWVAIISCPTSCAPPCNPNSPPASDNCSDAPPICDLNGYCGTTKNGPPNGYCPDYPGNFTSAGGSSSTAPCNISHASTSGSNLFSGSIENNSWLKFVASDVTATFNVYVTNCVPTSGGIQMGIYQGTNCNNFALMSPFGLTGAGITGTSQITGTGLTAGNVYYIMVDGISGAVCNYTVEAVSGVQMGSSISQDQTICLGQSALIDVSTIGGIIATWSSNPVDPNMPASGNNIAVSPTQTTTYSTHVTSTNGFCTFDTTLTTTVTVLQANDPLCQQNVQCTINVAANPTTVCSGEPVDITSDGNIVRTLLANTFNSGTVGVGWVGGTTANFTNPCNTPLPFGTTFLWMDDAAAAPRTLATNNFDVSNGATISFWMRFAIQGGTAPCEGPDMPGEGVSLQYSTTNGSTWQDITYFSPGGTQMTTNPDPNYTQTANGNALVTTGQTTPFTAWARYSFAIPIAAQTTATRFRWFQKNSTALNTDNWGIDSVMIVTPPLQIGIAWHSNPTASAADLITTNIVGTTNNETIHPTQTAWYVAEISDGSASCKDSVQVNVLTALVANAGSDVTTCSGVSSQLNATPAGATSCSWTSLPTGFTSNIANPTVNPTITTTYIVNVNNNGCTGTDQVVVNINSAVTAEAGNNISICPDGNAQLSASPNNATSYSWTSNTDNFTSTIFNPTVTPSANTTYTVNINNNGCTGSDIVTVTIRNLPAISAGNDVTICAGVPTSLTASNGLTYKWSNAGETTTSISVSPSIESTYTVTGTDVNGCSNIDQVVVFMNPPAVISAGNDVSICKNTSTQLGASGGSTYTWTSTPASVVPNVSNPTVSPTITTTYCVTGTDAQGCTGSDCVVVTVNNLPLVSAGADQSICPYESATFTGSNASTYVWSPNGETTQSITINQPTAQASYTVVGTDANGCTNSDQVVIYVKPLPTAYAGTDKSICLNGSTVLNASAGTSYLWDNGAGASSSVTVSPMITTLYNVTVTNTQGCTASDDVNVTVNPLPTVDAGNDQIICSGFCANLTGNNSTSIGGDTWKWSTGQTSQSVNVCPNTTTTYILTVTDANGCTASDMVTVTVNPLPFVYAGIDQAICVGSSATLDGSGADSFDWDNGAGSGSSVTVSPVATITYTVTGTDANGCSATDAVKITVNPIPTSDFTVNPNPVCARSFSTITYTGTGSAGATYDWSFDGAITTGAGAGPYQASWDNAGTVNVCLTVTQNSCISPQTCVPVEVLPLPTIVFSSDKIEGCQPLAVQFADNTSAVPVAWSWNFGDNTSANNTSAAQNPTHDFESPGQYDVRLTATSSEGCVNTMLFEDMITVYKNPVAEFYNLPEVGDCENNTISFFPSGTSNNVVAWEWDFGDYNANSENPNSSIEEKPDHKYVEIGNYDATLIVSTEHGCKDTISKNIFLRECYAFYIPNAFTPNDDGMNEYWGPKGIGIDPDNFEMYIFSRWGELLYKTTDLEKPWDGRPTGSNKICQQGVYSWIINVKEKDGVMHKYVGHLTLVK